MGQRVDVGKENHRTAELNGADSTYRTRTIPFRRFLLQPNHHHVRGGENLAAEEPVFVGHVAMGGQDT